MLRQDTVRLGRIGIWLTGLLVVGLAAGFASPAKADLRVLNYTGSLSLQISILPGASAAGSGVVTVNTYGGHLSTLWMSPAGIGPISASVPVTSSGTINSVIFTGIGNLTGAFGGISGGPPGGGQMGMSGVAKICLLFAPCAYANVPIPISPTLGGAGMGIGGTQFIAGFVNLTMQHNPWTVGQPSMTMHTPGSTTQWWGGASTWHSAGSTTLTWPGNLPGGFAHGPASGTTSTALPGGVLQLVTVSKVYTSLVGAFPELPVAGILRLHLVPEPGTLLLLGSGVAGLAVLGRRRRSG